MTVFPDRSQEEDVPEFSSLQVYRTVRDPGEYVTREAKLEPRDAIRTPDGPGSAWIIDLGGQQVPCEKLSIDVAGKEFVRRVSVELLDGEGPRLVVAQGELRRRASDARMPMEVALEREVTARRLRLVVTDNSNPPLQFKRITYTAAARQVVFAAPKNRAEPLKLYVGNPHAAPPRYDFAATLPGKLAPPPARTSVGEATDNPVFQPPPKPWTESLALADLCSARLCQRACSPCLAASPARPSARHDAAQAAAPGQDHA